MGQILHGCAKTIETMSRLIQYSQESSKTLSERYGLNPKTVLKWRKRTFIHVMSYRAKQPHSSVLTLEEKAIKHTLLRFTLQDSHNPNR